MLDEYLALFLRVKFWVQDAKKLSNITISISAPEGNNRSSGSYCTERWIQTYKILKKLNQKENYFQYNKDCKPNSNGLLKTLIEVTIKITITLDKTSPIITYTKGMRQTLRKHATSLKGPRSLILNFLDTHPGQIWIKDMSHVSKKLIDTRAATSSLDQSCLPNTPWIILDTPILLLYQD